MSFNITTSRALVLEFIDALNDENFDAARKLVTDDFNFAGVLGSRDGADVYFEDMQKMKLKYSVLRAFADGEDVCVLYDITMGDQKIYSAGWYIVQDKHIKSLRVVFDPRPLLDKK